MLGAFLFKLMGSIADEGTTDVPFTLIRPGEISSSGVDKGSCQVNQRVILHRLVELKLSDESGTQVMRIPPHRCNLIGLPSPDSRISFLEFLEFVLYGTSLIKTSGTVSMVFTGSKTVQAERDLATSKAQVRIGGRLTKPDAEQSLGEFLFGLSEVQFRKAVIVDTRDFVLPAGVQALGNHLRDLLLPTKPTATSAKKTPPTQDLQSVRSKRQALERQLELMPKPSAEVAIDPIDPPDIEGLVQALEQTREIEKRILERRIRLADELKKTTSQDQACFSATTAPILGELEKIANLIEETEGETKKLRTAVTAGFGFAARSSVIISLMIAAGAAAIGGILAEPLLTKVAIGLGVLSAVGIIAMWLRRMNRIMLATQQAKAVRAKRTKLRDRASKLCLRIGTAASGEDLNPESLRILIDRTSKRDAKRHLQEILSPFVDTDSELVTVKKLFKALQSPLHEAAEIRDRDLPQVPLVRLTQSAMGILSDWTKALSESGRRVESAVSDKVRFQVERELVEQSLEKLIATERTLELNKGRNTPKKEEPSARIAKHLNQIILPLLQRHLGELAPQTFGADLTPSFRTRPDSTVNSFIALALRLFNPGVTQSEVSALGKIVIDPGLAVGAALEARLGQLIAHSPICGSLLITHSRQELADSFARSMVLEIGSSIGKSSWEDLVEPEETTLYSAHDHPEPQAGSPSHVLLKSASD